MSRGEDLDRVLTPSLLGQYISRDSCPRYFRYRTVDANVRYERNWWDQNNVGVFLSEVGTSFEADQLRTLADGAHEIVGLPSDDPEFDFEFDDTWAVIEDDDLTHAQRQAEHRNLWWSHNRPSFESLLEDTAERNPDTGPTVLYQLPIRGQIGHWEISGLSDILGLYPTEHEDTVRSLLLEVKASWSEKSAHQIQAATYSLLVDQVAADLNCEHEGAAAIIHRDRDLRDLDLGDAGLLDNLDTFDLGSRITEVRRLLRENGELHDIQRASFGDVGYRLDRKCDGCEFNEICFTKGIESKDPALLGITQGDRQRLSDHGIETLDEFADLYECEELKKPYEYDGLSVADGNEAVVQSLGESGTLGNRLPELVQRAQLLAGKLDPTYEDFDFVEFLKGSGNGKLPEDAPLSDKIDPSVPDNGLIRVYLHVQQDYVRDRIVLAGARINGHHIEPRTVVELADELPMGEDESRQTEEQLLRSFFTQLFSELRDAAHATEYVEADLEDGDIAKAYFHLYVYSQHHRDALLDAVRRHPRLSGSRSIRDLLGLREGLDQAMVSVVHDEVVDRLALYYPGTGLVQTVEQMKCGRDRVDAGYHDKTVWFNDQWEAMAGGDTLDLQTTFRTGLFERHKPYREQGESIELLLSGSGDESPDGFYPVRNRFDGSIPLEYVWGVRGELTAFLEDPDPATQRAIEAAEDPVTVIDLDESVLPYLYRDHTRPEEKRERISDDDVKTLCAKLCAATEHVERSIRYKNAFLNKEPLPADISTFGIPDVSLAEACQEYLSLEQATTEQELLDHYMDLPLERVKSGESTIIQVTDIIERENNFGTYYDVVGELAYDDHFEFPDRILDSCKVHGGDGDGAGSWMVATPLRPSENGGFDQAGVSRPEQIRNSPRAKIRKFDRTTGEVWTEVDGEPFPPYRTKGYRFVDWHRGLTDQDSYAEKSYQWQWEPFETGDLLVLDSYADSWPHERAYDALDHAGTNYLYGLLRRAYSGGESDQFDVGFADPDVIDAFLDEYESAFELAPKGKQREFICHAEQAVSVLQGPPGTGKTSYTLAPAVISRLYAFIEGNTTLVGGVTAPSHTAVNEALQSVHDRLAEVQTNSPIDVGDVEMYRVGGSGANLPEEVPHIDYQDEDDREMVRDALRRVDEDGTHVLLFATPTSMRGIVDKLVKHGTIPAAGADSAGSAEEFMNAGGNIYDLLVVDEASMLDLPNTLLAGAFLANDGQALFIGDHRQMEPVQTHEWEIEDRRTIEENVPFMSALNFLRFLRGDISESEFTERHSPEIGDAIPMTGLDRTYRMHKLLADILTRLVYADDGITLQSDRTETLENVRSSTVGVNRVLDPDAPVVLLIHDEAASQDANLTEVAIVEALADALDGADAEDIGVITPHNAQKGRLRERLGGRATPNTVEKFQGGERDAIFVSATASDPDYVRAESDFLLNPNRLNVAMSRMKKKLVVIASESVFRMIPTDADEYDEAIIWKRLYGEMGVVDKWDPDARYSLCDFLPDGIERPQDAETTTLSVYTLRADDRRSA